MLIRAVLEQGQHCFEDIHSCGEIHHKGNYEISLDFIERLNDLLRNGPNYPLPELGQSVIYREINT